MPTENSTNYTNIDSIDLQSLLDQAIEAREAAYAPYSDFKVGAALLAASGKVYTGCNVENASYGASICAERNAALSAVKAGERHFKALAVIGNTPLTYPCGICLQFLSEFADSDMLVLLLNEEGQPSTYLFSDLLPEAFKKSQMEPEHHKD